MGKGTDRCDGGEEEEGSLGEQRSTERPIGAQGGRQADHPTVKMGPRSMTLRSALQSERY